MSASGSVSGQSRLSRSRDSRTRLGTHDSNHHSHSFRGDRARSGSPTEFWRRSIIQREGISNRVYDLNVFIYKGIEKFLDKQAVRDLIMQFDNEDIFIGGADIFFSSLHSDEMTDTNFNRNDKKRLLDVVDILSAVNSGKPEGEYPDRSKLAGPTQNGAKRTNGGPFIKPRSSLWTSFFSAIRIKIFHVHQRQKSAMRERSDSEFFAHYP